MVLQFSFGMDNFPGKTKPSARRRDEVHGGVATAAAVEGHNRLHVLQVVDFGRRTHASVGGHFENKVSVAGNLTKKEAFLHAPIVS